MRFEEIQRLLGELETNQLIKSIILLNQASDDQTDPGSHNRAIREFLLTMLAFTVVSAPDEGADTASVTSIIGRFEEIAREMLAVRNDPSVGAPALN